MIIKSGILGVSGYTGQELIKWLYKHPNFNIHSLFSTSIEGIYSDTVRQFSSYTLPNVQLFEASLCSNLDIIFLAVPHTKAMPIVQTLQSMYPTLKIVDLSADFRLKDGSVYESYYQVPHTAQELIQDAVYGLPEIYASQISQATLCANPGCYATSIILGTVPLKGILDASTPIVIDAKSGVSGAGKSLKESSLYCEVNETLSAYGTGHHRHLAELEQEVGLTNVMFSPHLVPINRGIESAIYILNESMTQDELFEIYANFYEAHPFVVLHQPEVHPSTKLVNHTNDCSIIPKKIGNWIVIFSLLDNLVKGASGQAIQNANLMFGLEETTGLN